MSKTSGVILLDNCHDVHGGNHEPIGSDCQDGVGFGGARIAGVLAPKSPKKFTQPQLLACLVLKAYQKSAYRGTEDLLGCAELLRRALGLKSVPDHSTLQKFADLLMRAAQQSLAELLADPKYLGAKPGIISALHTWGRTLSVHPHAHCLVTAGGIDRNGQFVPLQGKTLLPARVLMAVFRGKLRHLLKTALDDGRLSVPPALTVARTHSLLNRLGRVPWNVRIQERYRHGVSVPGYLARYITGGPISNRRIHAITSTEIAFWYRDHRDGGKKLLRLTPDEFLSRWFEHVPPKGLRTIRHSGIYSNSSARKREHLRQQMLESPAEVPQPQPATASASLFLLEPERCPVCNTDVICRDMMVVREHRPILRPPLVPLTQPP